MRNDSFLQQSLISKSLLLMLTKGPFKLLIMNGSMAPLLSGSMLNLPFLTA